MLRQGNERRRADQQRVSARLGNADGGEEEQQYADLHVAAGLIARPDRVLWNTRLLRKAAPIGVLQMGCPESQ